MKKLLVLLVLLNFNILSFAQSSVGIGTASPNASAILDLSSSTKGLLIPRMTTAERIAIVSPAKGLMVFDNTTSSHWFYSGAAWAQVAGTGGSTFTLPYAGSDAGGTSFQVTNTLAGGTAIAGKANGSNTNAVGVYGESASANAVKGYSSNAGSVAVFGSSLSGTGVKAYSFTGTALDVIGNVKISGGNTNPTDGAVLTSDAAGNATWKSNRVAFKAFGYNTNYTSVVNRIWKKLYFANENYDFANNFTPYAVGSSPAANSSTFSITTDGVYHFESNISMAVSNDPKTVCSIRLMLNRSGNITQLQSFAGVLPYTIDFFSYIPADLKISGDFLLFNNDLVYVEVFQGNETSIAGILHDGYEYYFSGNLVMPY